MRQAQPSLIRLLLAVSLCVATAGLFATATPPSFQTSGRRRHGPQRERPTFDEAANIPLTEFVSALPSRSLPETPSSEASNKKGPIAQIYPLPSDQVHSEVDSAPWTPEEFPDLRGRHILRWDNLNAFVKMPKGKKEEDAQPKDEKPKVADEEAAPEDVVVATAAAKAASAGQQKRPATAVAPLDVSDDDLVIQPEASTTALTANTGTPPAGDQKEEEEEAKRLSPQDDLSAIPEKYHKMLRVVTNNSGYAVSGTLTFLMGPSGAGKSSFFRVLKNKLPYTGTIRYDGPEFAVYEMEQNAPNLMAERTVSQTIQLAIETNDLNFRKLGRVNPDAMSLAETIDAVQLAEVKNHKIVNLSGGQRIRVAIAQALVTSRPIILMDEPLSGLDHHTAIDILRLIKSLAVRRNVIIIMTIHDPSQKHLDLANNIHFISAKGPVFFGSLEQMGQHIRAAKTLYERSHTTVNQNFIDDLFDPPKELATNVMNRLVAAAVKESFGIPMHGDAEYTTSTGETRFVQAKTHEKVFRAFMLSFYKSHQPTFDYGMNAAIADVSPAKMYFIPKKIWLLYKELVSAYFASKEGFRAAAAINTALMLLKMLAFPLLDRDINKQIPYASLIYSLLASATITQVLTVLPFLRWRKAARAEAANGKYTVAEFDLAMDLVVLPVELFLTLLLYIPPFFFARLPDGSDSLMRSLVPIYVMKLCMYASNKMLLSVFDEPNNLLSGATTLVEAHHLLSGFLNPFWPDGLNWMYHINWFTHGLRAVMNTEMNKLQFWDARRNMYIPGRSVTQLYNMVERYDTSMAYLVVSLIVLYIGSILVGLGPFAQWPRLFVSKQDREEHAQRDQQRDALERELTREMATGKRAFPRFRGIRRRGAAGHAPSSVIDHNNDEAETPSTQWPAPHSPLSLTPFH